MNKTTQYILIAILSAILVFEITFVVYGKMDTNSSLKNIKKTEQESVPSAPSVPSPFSKL